MKNVALAEVLSNAEIQIMNVNAF